nr:immunoglobulin light chain junction region [Macaca mulatta]
CSAWDSSLITHLL